MLLSILAIIFDRNSRSNLYIATFLAIESAQKYAESAQKKCAKKCAIHLIISRSVRRVSFIRMTRLRFTFEKNNISTIALLF